MQYETKTVHINPPTSLIEDSGSLKNRLRDVYQSLTKLGEALHGPEPREVSGEANAPEPIPTVRGNIDAACRVLDRIETELQRIGGRL